MIRGSAGPSISKGVSRTALWCALLVLSSVAIVCARNQQAIDPPMLETTLHQRGINTDTKSLIDVVRSNRESGDRLLAIAVLGERRETAARSALRQVLATADDWSLKESAAYALARLGDEGGKAALEKLMPTAPNLRDQVLTARSLAEFGNPAGYKFVLQAAASKDQYLKSIAIDGLMAFVPLEGRTGQILIDPSRQLLQLLKDPDPQIRKQVLIYLPGAVNKGRFPGAEARSIVEKLAKEDADPEVRQYAGFALISWPGAERR